MGHEIHSLLRSLPFPCLATVFVPEGKVGQMMAGLTRAGGGRTNERWRRSGLRRRSYLPPNRAIIYHVCCSRDTDGRTVGQKPTSSSSQVRVGSILKQYGHRLGQLDSAYSKSSVIVQAIQKSDVRGFIRQRKNLPVGFLAGPVSRFSFRQASKLFVADGFSMPDRIGHCIAAVSRLTSAC